MFEKYLLEFNLLYKFKKQKIYKVKYVIMYWEVVG